MKKIYSKATDKEKQRLVAKVYGKNVIEFKRKGKTWRVIGDRLQVLSYSDDDPEKVRSFELNDGEVKADNADDFEIKEEELKVDDKKDDK